MPPIPDPSAHPKFTLNTAGVAGFFGGDEAISAMATVHLYKGRRWLGWFNSPGSYTIAKCFGKMANSRFWDGLFPGHNDPPEVAFGLDGREGPEYIAALSGTKMRAGHLAYLAMERGKEVKLENLGGRETVPCDVAYLAMNAMKDDTRVEQIPVERRPFKKALYGLLPITVSVATCVMCALVYDWVSFSMILIGIISSGWASLVIGRGRLTIKSVEPASGAPPGHGILIGKDGVMVIKGKERDVNAITKGRFVLEANPDPKQDRRLADEKDNESKQRWGKQGIQGGTQDEEGKQLEAATKAKKEADKQQCYHAIGVCSLVLLVQFLLQLLLIPQGTLFGQIMFLISLGVSWMYNSYLSSLEKEKIQAQILFQALRLGDPQICRFRAGTRTTMAVFACLLLFHRVKSLPAEEDYDCRVEILEEFLPNKTTVWRKWRQMVASQLRDPEDNTLSHLKGSDGVPQLLKVLLQDARTAFEEYFRIRGDLPADSAEG